tara:strand:+ start:51 stop:509 length:459 start_codon:yes stop_codon:yes gene_type:complete
MPVSLPPEAAQLAQDQNARMEEGLSEAVTPPERPYAPSVVSGLSKAVAAIVGLMGGDYAAVSYDAPVAELDPELVRFLVMISKAASDYGQPFPVDLDALRTDRDVALLAGFIEAFVTDRDFKDFLEADEPDVEEEVPMEEEVEEDFDFSKRM